MCYNKKVIANLSTINFISSKLDEDLKSFFIKTTSISISVFNNETSSLVDTPKEFEKYIESINKKINTLHAMMTNITNNNKCDISSIKTILNNVDRKLKEMKFKIFNLRKAIETECIIELRIVSDSFTQDINILRDFFKNLKDTSDKVINTLKYS